MATSIYAVTGTAPNGEVYEHEAIAFDEADAIDRIVHFYHPSCFEQGTVWSASIRTKRHEVAGRLFVIVAEFEDSDEGTRQANAFMEQHPDIGVLDVADGRVILASNNDKGIPA